MYEYAIKLLKDAKKNEEALMKRAMEGVKTDDERIGAVLTRQGVIFDLEDAIMTLESIACEGEADDS